MSGGGEGLALDRPGMGAAGRGEAGGPRARPAPLAPLALPALLAPPVQKTPGLLGMLLERPMLMEMVWVEGNL